MKNYILLFVMFSFLVACSSSTNESEDTKTDATEATVTPEEEDWNTFWEAFKLSVTKNDVGGVVKHINFPMKNLLVSGEIKAETSKVDFIKNYKNLFGTGLRERIMMAKEEEWKSIIIKNAVESKMYNAPMNAEIKTLNLNFDEGATESALILSFVKKDGKYKWSSMNVAG